MRVPLGPLQLPLSVDAPGPLSILVYAVAPAPTGHEYLLLRRIPSEGGFWQGVTGAVEPGEALDEAAIREFTEETALAPIRLLAVNYSYSYPLRVRPAGGSQARHITEHVFLAQLSAKVDPAIDPTEHDAWDWFRYREALLWLRWPGNIEALKRCESLVDPGPIP
jgi:8-oxo-dGTP pyrophosphatase MutT (NUDIX family)